MEVNSLASIKIRIEAKKGRQRRQNVNPKIQNKSE